MAVITHSKPLYQQAYAIIKESILKGKIKPGSKISVAKLAEDFQISRTPLREALRQLTKEGLLVQNNSGSTVVSINRDDFEELLNCRLILEKEVIRLVVPKITDSELKKAQDLLKDAETALNKKDHLKILDCNTRFHEIFIQACPNKRLVELIGFVRSLLLLYRANIIQYHDYNSQIILEHQSILNAVKDRDQQKAMKMIEEHLLKDKERGMRFFERHDLVEH